MRTLDSVQRRRRWLLLLLLIPFIALLYPPFYNFWEPRPFGIPFFYWYQLLWVIITSFITALVYFLEGRNTPTLPVRATNGPDQPSQSS